jgi:mono/diheme cytochrome c family protein
MLNEDMRSDRGAKRARSHSGLRGRLAAALVCAALSVLAGRSLWALEFPPLQRGDANNDSRLDIADGIAVLQFLFLGGRAPPCSPVADANDSGMVDITDGIFILQHLFLGGPTPPVLTQADLVECRGLDPAAVERGLSVYRSPDLNGNLYSCDTCHSSEPDAQALFLRPGCSLNDALARPSFKRGQLPRFIDGSNTCREHWMETTVWGDQDAGHADLVAFLSSIAPPGPAPALMYDIVAPSREGPAVGDPQAGCELFHNACVICHGAGARGTEIAPSLVEFELGADFIRAKVRLSGPRNTVYGPLLRGGVMPFWTRDRISDEQLEDLAAYLTERPVRECTN